MTAAAFDVDKFIGKIQTNILNPLIALFFALALVYFLYGVWESIRKSDSSEGRETGGRHMLWGIIGMAIMVSAFGLVNLICNTIGCN